MAHSGLSRHPPPSELSYPSKYPIKAVAKESSKEIAELVMVLWGAEELPILWFHICIVRGFGTTTLNPKPPEPGLLCRFDSARPPSLLF